MARENIKTICQYKDVDIVHVLKPSETLKTLPDLKNKILAECDQVQRSVWNPVQTIEENTINTDLLLLLNHKDKFVGFLSANCSKMDDHDIVYLHDVMISREYQGRGFCRLLSLLLILDVFDCFAISKFEVVTAKSNSRLISTLYTKRNVFKTISFPAPNEFHKILLKRISKELFDDIKINVEKGMIEKIWGPPPDEKQHISRAKNLTLLLGRELMLGEGGCTGSYCQH